ncbi:MAG: hypothetical protein KDD69_09390 [Bdellovibrionales bacterium]|nr:hypothetical protein [Bdellovibrionales bacterium]
MARESGNAPHLWYRAAALLKQVHGPALFLVGLTLLHAATTGSAYAAEGSGIFEDAACTLLDDVLTKDFGATLSAIAGLLAIMASVVGSFKAAWALVFVTVGTFIFPNIVGEMFTLGCGGGGP